jgi:F-type H+-transporting ATPase subunit b
MTFNPWTFLFEALNFVVLVFILHRLLYRPLREAIERRREAAERAQHEAEQARQEAAALQQRLAAQMTELEQQRQDALRKAREEAEGERRKLLEETEKALQHRREEAQRALERGREEALRALRVEVSGWAIDLAGRLLSESADRTLHGQLALHLIEVLHDLPEKEREQLRTYWQPDDAAVLETAGELEEAVLQQVGEGLSAVLGWPVTLTTHREPALRGGVRLRLGGHVWDASLAGQLEEARRLCAEEGKPCLTASAN